MCKFCIFQILTNQSYSKFQCDHFNRLIDKSPKRHQAKQIQDSLQQKVTTHAARHSFSAIMKRSGVSTEFIQEALGYTNIKTTENYLDSFEKEVKKEFAGKLVPFKSISVQQ